MHICVFGVQRVNVYIQLCSLCTCMHNMYICITYVHMCIHIYIYIYTYIILCIYLYIYIYIYIYIHTYNIYRYWHVVMGYFIVVVKG